MKQASISKDKPRSKNSATSNFKVAEGSTWRRVVEENSDGEPQRHWVPFASEVSVLAMTRSAEGEDWGRLVSVLDPDGQQHIWAMPAANFAGSGDAIRAELLRLGMRLAPGRRSREWLDEYLMSVEPEKRARCVTNIGWHGEVYVFPDETIGAGETVEEVILQSTSRLDHALNQSGTLTDWQREIGRRAVGNSRLVLAISAAFAAPLLEITGDDGGGFHFRGASSSGKSTALAVAGSVWGGGGRRGYVKSWRVTDNGLEALAALHNDACLCLDELSQVDSRAASAAAYMLGNGAGKSRAGRDGQARRAYEWRLIFISNGETGLADKISESGGRIAAGMEVRVIDLRADAGAGLGLFEEVHGAENAASFAQALKAASGKNYGTPARYFLQKLVEVRDELPGGIASLRETFLKAAVPEGADGQVSRVASRFALVAAAGELASSMGVTGWSEGVAIDAALRCFHDWLTERGGIGAGEVADAKNRLRQAIEVDGSSRFFPWHRDPRVVLRSRTLGYLRRGDDGNEDQPPTYYIHSSGMNEILSGLDRRTVLEGLASEGIIIRQQEKNKGKTKSVLTKIFKVPSENTGMRLYQLDFSALTGGGADGAE